MYAPNEHFWNCNWFPRQKLGLLLFSNDERRPGRVNQTDFLEKHFLGTREIPKQNTASRVSMSTINSISARTTGRSFVAVRERSIFTLEMKTRGTEKISHNIKSTPAACDVVFDRHTIVLLLLRCLTVYTDRHFWDSIRDIMEAHKWLILQLSFHTLLKSVKMIIFM